MKNKLTTYFKDACRAVFNLKEDEPVTWSQSAGLVVVLVLIVAIFAVVRI
jgi:hypothetical protein